jgi:hypothetical protein
MRGLVERRLRQDLLMPSRLPYEPRQKVCHVEAGVRRAAYRAAHVCGLQAAYWQDLRASFG